mmetsp:Transcript_790/g.969  ORF Transcript_790/g.969 Transcript_790/m.969 type:complete len:191 (-) Transcript_790:722-1294(-)
MQKPRLWVAGRSGTLILLCYCFLQLFVAVQSTQNVDVDTLSIDEHKLLRRSLANETNATDIPTLSPTSAPSAQPTNKPTEEEDNIKAVIGISVFLGFSFLTFCVMLGSLFEWDSSKSKYPQYRHGSFSSFLSFKSEGTVSGNYSEKIDAAPNKDDHLIAALRRNRHDRNARKKQAREQREYKGMQEQVIP